MGTPLPPADPPPNPPDPADPADPADPPDPVSDVPAGQPADRSEDSSAPLSAFAELDPVHPTPPPLPAPVGVAPLVAPLSTAPLSPASRAFPALSAVGPISGICFVGLFLLSFLVMSTPEGDASNREWTSHWEDSGNRTQGIVAAIAMALAGITFLWLVAALRRRLAGAVGTDAFHAAGIAAGALMLISSLGAGLVPLGYELADTPIPDDADLLRTIDGLYFGTIFLPLPYALAGFLIPLFFALRGSLLVPAWLEWATLVVGVVALAGPILFVLPHALFLLWTLATSVTLLVRERPV